MGFRAKSIRRGIRHNFVLPVAWLFLFALLAGCADPRQALAPPDADVEGIQTVVVFAVGNETPERDITEPAEAGLVQRLSAIGWYDVISPERATRYLQRHDIDLFDADIDSTSWNEIARDATLDLDGDGFVLTTIVDYDERIIVGAAFMTETDEGVAWYAEQTTVAEVTWRGKLVNAHTGAVVYERTVIGEGRVSDARLLNWIIPDAPPAHVIPAPHRRDVEVAREAAVADALDKFTRDILPRVPAE